MINNLSFGKWFHLIWVLHEVALRPKLFNLGGLFFEKVLRRIHIFGLGAMSKCTVLNCFEDEFLPSFLCKPGTQKKRQQSHMSPVMQFETTATQSLAKPVNGRQKENGITGSSPLISPF